MIVLPIKHTPNPKRFWSRVNKTETCWIWLGGVDKDGYGKFQITLPRKSGITKTPQKHVRAHRYAFELKTGRRPRGGLLHECDVKRCVRVGSKHVHEGTQRRNIRDSLRRGRSPRCVTPDVVRAIRREVKLGRGSMKRMEVAAKKYGVSRITVQWIVYYVTWRWIR